MQTARSGHVAVLLPNNNQVLIAGGMSAGAAVASAELYADWRDGFSTTPNPMSVARAGGIAGGLQPFDLAFVAGGGATTGEYYGYATVKTDREDYCAGRTGHRHGLRLAAGRNGHADHLAKTPTRISTSPTARSPMPQGTSPTQEFAPIENEVFQHFGKRFYRHGARRGVAGAEYVYGWKRHDQLGTVRNSVHQRRDRRSHSLVLDGTGVNPCSSADNGYHASPMAAIHWRSILWK